MPSHRNLLIDEKQMRAAVTNERRVEIIGTSFNNLPWSAEL